ncbi:ornithine cyclodeaminase family protein [Streptomyces omiyaensis]|uniref:ornithine cyclodeaminase family protein n=1 Tax=Streptomyces omiyaensis TaxID=68247 RepID=UPI0036FC877B
MSRFPLHTADRIRAAVDLADLVEPVAAALTAHSTTEGARAPVMVLPAVGHGEHHLSDLRTAAAGAVCARALARPDASRATVLGTGRQAGLQSRALALVRPVGHLHVWGRGHRRATALADRLGRELPHVDVTAVTDLERAVRRSDVVVTATAGTTPVLRGAWLRPGQHVTAVGADDPVKRELDADCLRRATRLLVDSRELALRYGDVYAALSRGEVTKDRIDGEIGAVLAGRTEGRRTPEDITLAKLIGIGPQDLAAAETALALLEAGAVRPRGKGTEEGSDDRPAALRD